MPDPSTPQSVVVVPPPAANPVAGTAPIPLVIPEPVTEGESARLMAATRKRLVGHKDFSVHGNEIRSIGPNGQLHITNPDLARAWTAADEKGGAKK